MEKEKAKAVIEAVLFTMGESVEVSKLAELMDKLFSVGRLDDAKKAVKDENFRAGLFKEFKIL